MKRLPIWIGLLLGLSSLAGVRRACHADERPNIVVLLADDLGYGDVGVNGCQDIPTPHLDSLAHNGVRFTSGYSNNSVCAPARAALLSGRYQHRFGFEFNPGQEANAAPNFGLPRSETTLAERLKSLGYATGMVGKWHLGFTAGLQPHERGFDSHFGFLGGAHHYVPGDPNANALMRNGKRVKEPMYLTDAFARDAAEFIEGNRAQPFFLYLAFNAVHVPFDPSPYEATFAHLEDPKRRTYAGMLTGLDLAVGKVLAKLREHNLEDNTLIFFFSDNGGPTPSTTSRNTPLRGTKGRLLEGGIRVPFLAQWKARLPAGLVYDHPVMGFDVHATSLAAAGGTMPADQPLDGVDLVPYLTGQNPQPPHQGLFWRSGEQGVVRLGDWKLLRLPAGTTELYNLATDIGEARDLAAQEPQKLAELQAAYDAWDRQMQPPKWGRPDRR